MSSARPLAAALVATASLGLAACSLPADRAETSGALRVVGPFEVHSLDPAIDGEVFTRLQVSETLVTADLDGKLVPGLAERWATNRSRREWTFELADGARYHDGTEVTAESVADSLRRAAAEPASPLAGAPVAEIEPRGSAVVVSLTSPSPALPAMLTHYSTSVLAPASYDDQGRVTEVIGTGPYEVTDVELPGSVETERSEEWRGEAPEVAAVSFQSVGRAESRAVMAAGDQADVVFGLEPAGRERVEASDSASMVTSLQPRTIMLKVNADHPVLGDLRVRRALSAALDRAAMADAVLREEELAATRLMPPSLTAWGSTAEPALTHDQDRARALLDEAGWTPGPDGVRTRDGEPLRLTLLTYPDRAELPALATAIQASLAEVGVAVEVDVANSSEIPAGHADGTLELALVAKHFALVSDPLVDVAEVFAADGSDWGVMGWRDPAVNRAVDSLLGGATGGQADRDRRTIVDTAQRELPLIPVSWYRMNAAVSDRVDGFVMDPLETSWHLADLEWSR